MTAPQEHIPARPLDLPYLAALMAQLEALPNPQAMNLEMLDGFFAGLICAPTLVMPSAYLPMILGDRREAFQFEKAQALPAFVALLTQHWNHMAQSLSAGELFLPLLLEDEQGHAAGNDWATGFMRAMQFDSQDWSALLNDETQGGVLLPIFALAYEHDPDPAMRPYGDTPVSAEQREQLLGRMAAGITTIYMYFEPWRGNLSVLHQERGETYQRTTPKIGRNDPCPCGSGRKYKLCHGQHRSPVSSPTRH